MAPLIVLITATLLARLAGQLGVGPLRHWAGATRVGLAVMFCFTAAAHFNSVRPDLIRMIPPAVPNPELMVTFTGLCEIAGAVGLLIPGTRRVAAASLILLLLAILPANIHAAQSGVTLRGAPPTPLVPRILIQVFFMALVWWSGFRESAVGSSDRRSSGRVGARLGSR
jgi:uncharacterized membrane protein